MSNQPNIRPWFRLASIARPVAPQPPITASTEEAQPPPQQQRPPLIRPAFTTSFRPPTTQPLQELPTQAPPLSPPRAATSATINTTSPPRAAASSTVNRTTSPPSPIGKNVTPKGSPSSTRIQVGSSSSSVPSSPKPRVISPNVSSVPNSPVPKNLPPNSPPIPSSPFISPLKPDSPATKYTVPNSSPPQRNSPIARAYNGSPTVPPTKNTTVTRLPTPPPTVTKQPLAKTPPQSPNINYNAPPPSPLVLPPAMLNHPEEGNGPKIPLEAEQKSVLVQKTMEKPKPKQSWIHGDSNNSSNIHGDNNEKDIHKSHNKKHSDSEEMGTRVITIAGENRGAFMELNYSQKKHGHFEGNPHSLMKKNGNESDTGSDNDGKSKTKDKKHEKMAINSLPFNAYVNNNVQGINNSIVFNSSYAHHDPGVHLSLARNPNGGHKMFHFKEKFDENHS